ncbi:hypothetical protein P692DRAFT_201842822 [Suillus brevipes Sb2]|nr:hypothetical protein P692DRAFT_201842822 [Suillus brevipes Sb2]
MCGSLDNMFKAANKATLTDRDHQKSRELKGGILSVLNEDNQIILWRFCQTRTNAEITELLQGLKHRHDILNVPQPKMMVADNCCQVRNAVTSAMPETDSKLDVWHFSARYIAVMLQSSKSPYRGTVAADITGAILKTHAEKGQPAQYWDRAEQERRLMVAFSKWADKGVWSAAAQKVHQEQLKHVRRGCLERSVQGIRADGSRIEGSHKGWNSLQRAQPSGVRMLAALGHDFVLRRNVRVAFSRPDLTPFLKFANGSHHLRLCNYIARLHNTLQPETPNSQLQILPELCDVDSGETFGLVVSDHVATFGGLLIKEESIEKGLLDSFDPSVDPTTGSPSACQRCPKGTSNSPQSDPPVLASTVAGQTRSQRLFSISTGIHPRSLTFQNSDEFYLFMEMRAEFKWLSYQMTSKRWVMATEEYNHCLIKKAGQSVIQKNPQALLCLVTLSRS